VATYKLKKKEEEKEKKTEEKGGLGRFNMMSSVIIFSLAWKIRCHC